MSTSPTSKESLQLWKDATTQKLSESKKITDNLLRQLQVEPLSPQKSRCLPSPFSAQSKGDPNKNRDRDVMVLENNVCRTTVLDEIQETRNMIKRMQQEHFVKSGPLKVVVWRLGLRQNRFPQDNIRDDVQEALEAEQDTLNTARQELILHVSTGKQLIEGLGDLRLGLDKSRQESLTEPLSPSSGAFSLDASASTMSSSTKHPQEMAQHADFIKRSQQLGEQVVKFYNRGRSLIATTSLSCARAAEKTQACLDAHIAETTKLKCALEEEVWAADRAIAAAEKDLKKARYRNDKNDENYVKNQSATQNLVNELRKTRQQLQVDLQCKMASLKIDVQCKRCSSDKADLPIDKTSSVQYVTCTRKLHSSGSLPNLGGTSPPRTAPSRTARPLLSAGVAATSPTGLAAGSNSP